MKKALEICDRPELHNVSFDNFFSSYKLLFDIDEKGFRATGTMRNDRIMKCPVKRIAEMKILEKGAFDYRSSGPIEIVRWNDNSVITLGFCSE